MYLIFIKDVFMYIYDVRIHVTCIHHASKLQIRKFPYKLQETTVELGCYLCQVFPF